MSSDFSVVCQCGEKTSLSQDIIGTNFVCPKCFRSTLISLDFFSAGVQSFALKPLRVILVEDSLVLRAVLRKALESVNYEVFEAEDGEKAQHVIRISKPDIIVMDYNMPNKTGVECLKELKAKDKTKHIPVMMCTSNADRDLVMECVRAGATDYIVKPVKEKNLQEKVGRLAGMVKSVPFELLGIQQTPRASRMSNVTPPAAMDSKSNVLGIAPAENPRQAPEIEENPTELFRRLPYNANIQRVTGFYIGEIDNVYSLEEVARKTNVDTKWLSGVLQLFEEAGLFRVKKSKVEFVKPFNNDSWRKLMDWAIEYVASGEDTSGAFERFFKD